MMNRFASVKEVSSRTCSLCAGSFCADKNNALLLDNAIALSVFICLIIAIILIPAPCHLWLFSMKLTPFPFIVLLMIKVGLDFFE